MTVDGADGPTVALVHRLAGEQALARGHRLLDARALEAACAAVGVGHDEFIAAARALGDDDVVNVRTFGPSLVALLRLTERGFMDHLTATRSDLDAVRGRVASTLRAEAVAGRLGEALDLAAALGEAPLLAEVLLDELRTSGQVVFTPIPGHRVRIHRVGPP